MNRRIMKLSLIGAVLALLCLVPLSRVRATAPGTNGQIAFQVDMGTTGIQIFTVRPNGQDLHQITHVSVAAVSPEWSPDGRLIAFEHQSATCANVAIMKPDGSDLIDIQPPSPNLCEGAPSFTPDGARIVFEQFNVDTSEDAIWIMRLDGSDRQFITTGTGSGVTDPSVSPDGRTLSFIDFNGLDFGQALFTGDIHGGNLFQVTPFTFDVAVKQDWAPNGRRLLFTDNADLPPPSSANIATIRPDGTGLRHLTHFQGGDVKAYAGSYSPDGSWIIFRIEDHGSFGLFRMHPDGSDRRTILDFSSFRPRNIAWGPRPLGAENEDDATSAASAGSTPDERSLGQWDEPYGTNIVPHDNSIENGMVSSPSARQLNANQIPGYWLGRRASIPFGRGKND
jgi:Tol biopolymer transport system component